MKPCARKQCKKCSRTRTITFGRLGLCNKCFVLVIKRSFKSAINEILSKTPTEGD